MGIPPGDASSIPIELQLQILSLGMGLVTVVVPIMIVVVGAVYIRRFEKSLNNLFVDLDEIWDELGRKKNKKNSD